MDFNQFHSSFAEILDIEENKLTDDFILDDSNVDSLSRLSLAALVIDLFQIELNDEILSNCKNYKELKIIIEKLTYFNIAKH